MSIDSAMMEIRGERFDCTCCSAPWYWWAERSAFMLQSIVITHEIWGFNGGEESPSEVFHYTFVDEFD